MYIRDEGCVSLNQNNVNLSKCEDTKLLGTVITKDFKWDKNTSHIVKKLMLKWK